MSYCAGWKYRGSVYVVADSAVTKSVSPSLPYSSIGETQQLINGYSVEEGLLKIVSLENNLVIAYAGDLLKATAIIDFIKNNRTEGSNIGGLIESINRSLGPFRNDRRVSLIIGNIADGDVNLIRWDSNNPSNFSSGKDINQIGSLMSYHGSLTIALLSFLVSGKVLSERMLPIATAIIQSYGVHENMMSQNIGGIIYGLSLNKDGVRWQEDTKYVLYDPDFKNIGVVTCLCRDNALAIRSSITNDTRILYHNSNLLSIEEWMRKWRSGLEKDFKCGSAKYWVFISKRDRNITVVKLAEKSSGSKYFKMNNLGNGVFDFAVHPDFMTMLTSPVIDRKDSSLPFRLTSLDG